MTITSASAPSAAASADCNIVDLGSTFSSLLAPDWVERDDARSPLSSPSTSGIDGASRISSVLGLKVRPSTPIRLPSTRPPSAALTSRPSLPCGGR